MGTFSDAVGDIEAYRAAYRAAGHPGEGQVFLRVPIYVAESADQAIAEPEASIMHFYRRLAAELAASATASRAGRVAELQSVSYDEVCRNKVVVGTPEMVADRLAELRDELGLNGILAELNCGGQIPHERVRRSLDLLCERVLPRFR